MFQPFSAVAPVTVAPLDVGTLMLGALVAAVLYWAACAWFPYLSCKRCAGSGKRRNPLGRGWRTCPRCDGRGRRVRLGRRLFEIGRDGL